MKYKNIIFIYLKQLKIIIKEDRSVLLEYLKLNLLIFK